MMLLERRTRNVRTELNWNELLRKGGPLNRDSFVVIHQRWNEFLASLAVTWAEGCDFEHGQPPLGNNPPYSQIGQNLYAATGSAVNLTAGIQAWYDEISDYDYDSMQCAADKPCGHYTQAGHHISVLP